MDKIVKSIKFMTDTLLIAIAYLLIKSYINGYFLGIVILINYASTIFIEALVVGLLLVSIFKLIKNLKSKHIKNIRIK